MSIAGRPIGVLTRNHIEHLWDAGFDSYEIAKRLGLDEPRVLQIIELHVTAKKFRKSAF